ncbi:MAG: type II toxin-antitoxin system HicA family toxin [Tagaea sp.]
MGRLAYKFVDVFRKLQAAGFVLVGQKGSHVKLARTTAEGTRVVIVPRHRELATGTLRSILRDAGLTIDDFEAL